MRTIVCNFIDAIGSVKVSGLTYRFEFSRYMGVLWVNRAGEPTKNQKPSKKVWAAFEAWLKERTPTEKEGA